MIKIISQLELKVSKRTWKMRPETYERQGKMRKEEGEEEEKNV